jgi:hypothetical protein
VTRIEKKIYISGPRMGTNNLVNGIEKLPKQKRRKKSGRKKRS